MMEPCGMGQLGLAEEGGGPGCPTTGVSLLLRGGLRQHPGGAIGTALQCRACGWGLRTTAPTVPRGERGACWELWFSTLPGRAWLAPGGLQVPSCPARRPLCLRDRGLWWAPGS